MAGQIQYQLSIQGLDEQIVKLTKVNQLLNQIGNKKLSGGFNNNTPGSAGSVGSSGGSTKQGIGLTEAAIIGGAAGGNTKLPESVNKLSKDIGTFTNEIKNYQNSAFGRANHFFTQTKEGQRQVLEELNKPPIRKNKKWEDLVTKTKGDIEHKQSMAGKLEETLNMLRAQGFGMRQVLSGGIDSPALMKRQIYSLATGQGVGPEEGRRLFHEANTNVHGENNIKQSEEAVKLFQSKIKNIPPILLPKGQSDSLFNKLKKLGNSEEVGGVAKGFGRELLGGRIMGLVTSLGRLGPIAAGVAAAFAIIAVELKILSIAVKEGAETFRNAARQGVSATTSNKITQAFKTLGMQAPDISGIAPQLGHGNDTGAILNAARSGQFGEQGQQLLNMSKQFEEAMYSAEESADKQAGAAASAMQISIDWANITNQIKSLFAQFLEENYQHLHLVLMVIGQLLKAAAGLYAFVVKLEKLVGLSAPAEDTTTTNKPYFFGGQSAPNAPTTSLEKLGLVFKGSNSPEQALKDINKNTNQTVVYLSQMVGLMKDFLTGGASGALLKIPLLP